MNQLGSSTRVAQCKWQVTYELTNQGWVLSEYRGDERGPSNVDHNHPLLQTTAEAMQSASTRDEIDPHLVAIGQANQRAGHSAADIYSVLQREAKEKNLRANFSIDDVRREFLPTRAEIDLDAENLISFLRKRVT